MIIMKKATSDGGITGAAVVDEQGIMGTKETWEKLKEAGDGFYNQVPETEILRHNMETLRAKKMLDQVSQDVIEGKVFGL